MTNIMFSTAPYFYGIQMLITTVSKASLPNHTEKSDHILKLNFKCKAWCFFKLVSTKCLPTFCIQEPRDTKLIVGNIKSIVEVLNMTWWLQGTEVDKIRAVGMDEGIEPKTTTPWTCTQKQNGTHMLAQNQVAHSCHWDHATWIEGSLMWWYLWSPGC